MLVCSDIEQIRGAVRAARQDSKTIGLVPTLGMLHGGHLSLITAAREQTDCVVVSIYVNPIQFCQGEDYQDYPRDLPRDLDLCRQGGVEMVFTPTDQQMYPGGRLTTVHVDKITEVLCGADRPGHFDGVTTVVAKLFNIVGPDVAYFGQKDAQQGLVICRMVKDLDFPLQIRICPTVREPDGLAVSSRNQYLNPAQRQEAPCLYKALTAARGAIASGQRQCNAIIDQMRGIIESAGQAKIDYIAIVDLEQLGGQVVIDKPVLIALAVQIGPARLIDNIVLDENGKDAIIKDSEDLE